MLNNSIDGATLIIIIIVVVGSDQVVQSSFLLGQSEQELLPGLISRAKQDINFTQEQLLDTTADEQNLTRQWRDSIPGPSVQRYTP